MTTFDLAEIRGFAADLGTRMDRCDNGEGMECASLDDSMRHYASLCCEFRENVRSWGREVFAGRLTFDPEVEKVFQTNGTKLYSRTLETFEFGRRAQTPCYDLPGVAILGFALRDLYVLMSGWVTPALAVGPSARQGLVLEPDAAAEAMRRIESLPPLPADWQPADLRQQMQYKKLSKN